MTKSAMNAVFTQPLGDQPQGQPSGSQPLGDQPLIDRPLGTPLGLQATRVLFLGSGELGKEVAIELMRLGAWVCAADSYAGAPAQQVAHESRVLDMADPLALQALFDEVKPDIIVPEVEAIATDVLSCAADAGVQVVPSAQIAAICMDRERLRVLAHEELGLPTTPYRFAGSLNELRAGAAEVGYPCVVKPVMSSSGHGQSVVRAADAIEAAWTEAQEGRRASGEGDVSRVIVEALAPLDYELTVLTVSSSAGIVTCAPIGQRQESGDYRESWQPATIASTGKVSAGSAGSATANSVLSRARHIARAAVEGLVAKAQDSGEAGWGVFGVELFVLDDGSILFNEVSPRPHDTGMVTMASQRLSEFALHARAILGLPVTDAHVELNIPEGSAAASHAIVVRGDGQAVFTGVAGALAEPGTDLRIFAKPEVHGHRRMGVALAVGLGEAEARAKASRVADALTITIC
jgi:phosphoribosylglycinamide formyltransferase 2